MTDTLDSRLLTLEDVANPWSFSLSVVIPAYNEGAIIGQVVGQIRHSYPYAEVIVVDDCSSDDTADLAEQAGAQVIRRPYNIGNGAGIKTGMRAAHGDVVVIIDGDGQHDPADIQRLLPWIGRYDMVIGARSRSSQQNWVRWLGNSAINWLGSYLTGMEMKDLTSGFRAFRRPILMHYLHLLPNQYSWPTTSALAFAKAGYHVRFEPIAMQRRQAGRSHQKLLKNGFKFATIILRIVSLFNPLRVFAPVAVFFVLLSLISYLLSVANNGGWLHMPPTAMLAFISALFFFMFGLLAEMIAALRFERYRD